MGPMPVIVLRVRTRPPYAPAEGVVRLVAEPRARGGFAVRLDVSVEIAETNPLTPRSRTDPVFLCDEAEGGFQRATEWVEEHFEVLGYESVEPG